MDTADHMEESLREQQTENNMQTRVNVYWEMLVRQETVEIIMGHAGHM